MNVIVPNNLEKCPRRYLPNCRNHMDKYVYIGDSTEAITECEPCGERRYLIKTTNIGNYGHGDVFLEVSKEYFFNTDKPSKQNMQEEYEDGTEEDTINP